MERQVTVDFMPVVYDYVSKEARINNESLSSFLNRYILQTMAMQKVDNDVAREELKAQTLRLRGILHGSSISDSEAKSEFLKDKYGI